MIIKEYISKNVLDNDKIAEQILKIIPINSCVLLNGDLGAGKTTLTKSIAKNLGVNENITSPTFTILNEYETEKIKLFHFDMYRIESEDDLIELGFEDIFNFNFDKDCYIFVEWAEKTPNLIPKNHYVINIEKLGLNERKFTLIKVEK